MMGFALTMILLLLALAADEYWGEKIRMKREINRLAKESMKKKRKRKQWRI